jgi:hypothetical protein
VTAGKTDLIRDTVYVVGAGFSAGLGYPLTKALLVDVWSRLDGDVRRQLGKVIEFHHPAFDPKRKTSFPDIEELLTEISVNLDLFEASRPVEGNFTKKQLEGVREALLLTIAEWFHELFEPAKQKAWLRHLVARLLSENAAIVSFNWDLILDELLFEKGLGPASYGLAKDLAGGPVLLKPHGSLNWYESSQIHAVPAKKRTTIFQSGRGQARECIEAFLYPREIRSKVGKRYNPLIVPPTYLKDFRRPLFQRLWNNCTGLLSTPKTLIFLGYSLPAADLHAQFIFRCGFHNQIEGRLDANGGRQPPTGAAKVIIVNPDQDAARRIESVAGPRILCRWIPKRIEEWLASSR